MSKPSTDRKEQMPQDCSHERLNEDGICRTCGADCRQSPSQDASAVPPREPIAIDNLRPNQYEVPRAVDEQIEHVIEDSLDLLNSASKRENRHLILKALCAAVVELNTPKGELYWRQRALSCEIAEQRRATPEPPAGTANVQRVNCYVTGHEGGSHCRDCVPISNSLACGHGRFDTRGDCLTCLRFVVDELNKQLLAARIAQTSAPSSPTAPAPTIRSCNRHTNCDEAEAELLARNPGKTKSDISFSFHCHDEDCEDCFGQ